MVSKWMGAALAALLAASGALAAPAGVVEAVRQPAWVERGGKKVPIEAGASLSERDALTTGEGGRLRVRLPEGSAVKLGEKAGLTIEKAQAGGVFRGVLVAVGAFRFTTDPERKDVKRDIEVRALNATAGVRGTDFWGKSTRERTFIVLIEGRIEVSSPGRPPVTIDSPLAYYERKGEEVGLRRIDARTLEAYARETEIP